MRTRIAALAAPAIRVATVTVTALVASAMPAMAHTVHRDATRDVVVFSIGDDSVTPKPLRKQGDIVRIRVAHHQHRVGVRLTFRSLTRRSTNSLFYRIRTTGGNFDVFGLAEPEVPQGNWELVASEKHQPVRCEGLRHRVDYADDKVRVSVPRSCVERPAKIRVGAVAQTWIGDEIQGPVDDAYSEDAPGERLSYGDWLGRC